MTISPLLTWWGIISKGHGDGLEEVSVLRWCLQRTQRTWEKRLIKSQGRHRSSSYLLLRRGIIGKDWRWFQNDIHSIKAGLDHFGVKKEKGLTFCVLPPGLNSGSSRQRLHTGMCQTEEGTCEHTLCIYNVEHSIIPLIHRLKLCSWVKWNVTFWCQGSNYQLYPHLIK